MAKKQFFALFDTETTISDTVADFAALIVDRKGEIFKQCAVLVKGEFLAKDLFHNEKIGELWKRQNLEKRNQAYTAMLNDGRRMLASPHAINKWILQAIGQYNPILTAYNLPFDVDKCEKTGIDLTAFSDKFCLWKAANTLICETKAYREFILNNHLFNNVTEYRNMTFKTNAESVCGFLNGEFKTEPHTALEDAKDFELPILQKIVTIKKWRERVNAGYDWNMRQVRDWYVAK